MQVRRLTGVLCNWDHGWCVRVLQSSAASLHGLKLHNPSDEHLAVVASMPRLQWLDLSFSGECSFSPPRSLPATLLALRVEGLSRAATKSLLRAHGPLLRVLWLDVGVEKGKEWPKGCKDLSAMLAHLPLKLLLLTRPGPGSDTHDIEACHAQMNAARLALPRCIVDCNGGHGSFRFEHLAQLAARMPLLSLE